MPRLTVSIINYRTAELTLAAIASVLDDLAHSPEIDGEIVVLDNASGDGSAEAIAAWIDANPGAPVRLMRSAVNAGFAGGHNRVLAATDTPFVLVMNSDAELTRGCLAALLAEAQAHPRAGLIGPLVTSETGARLNTCFRFPGIASEVIRGAHSGPVTRALRRWDVVLGADPDPAQIDWAEFSVILLRREMIDAIGPMDDGYFLYFEDIAYCLAARRAGWRVRHAATACAVHREGGSSDYKARAEARRRMPAYHYASRSRYFYQRGGYAGLWGANLAWTLGRVVARLRRLAGKPVRPAAEGEARDIWINAFDPLGPSHAPTETPRQ